MRFRRASAGAAVAAALITGFTGAPASADTDSASAVTCGNAYWPHTDRNGGDGKLVVFQAPARTGPYGACSEVAIIGDGAELHYDCYVVNDYGSRWTWVRERGGASFGWVYGAHLSGGGATRHC
ncbi:SH3 domain-containing protein [Streptomyces sp. bgisy100]|uniref:SH3 domain-containing protein n=1 Tax=Streptomyces sp. bgisy100 TaxID=3413783 RepID=UPI003D708371